MVINMDERNGRLPQRRGWLLKGASLAQYGLLVLLLAVSVLFSARAYVQINHAREGNYAQRSQLAYIANKLRAGDAAGCVTVRKSDGMPVLVITDRTESADYETRFYQYAGEILEEYTASENPLEPEKAQVVGGSALFDVQLSGGLVTVATDMGTVAVGLRTEAGNGR